MEDTARSRNVEKGLRILTTATKCTNQLKLLVLSVKHSAYHKGVCFLIAVSED